MKIWVKTTICALVAVLMNGSFQANCYSQEEQQTRTVLASLEELPERAYPLKGTINELIEAPGPLRAVAAGLREDHLADLDRYSFDDPAVERELYSRLLQADLILERLDDVMRDIRAMRRLSDTEAKRHMSVLHAEAWVGARKAVGEEADLETLRRAYATSLREAVAALPLEVVRGELAKRRLKMRMATEGVLRMMLSGVESKRNEDGSIDAASATALIGFYNALRIMVPLSDLTIEIYGEYLEGKDSTPAPIMTQRRQALSRHDDGRPVVVAIWDTGVDVEVFSDRLFVNPGERLDGLDTDHNGYVDDLHGIAFDLEMKPAQGLLMPHRLDSETLAQAKKLLKGAEDRRTGHSTPEAEELQMLGASLSPEERRDLGDTIMLYDLYSHGTHVAGIAVSGNPFARVLVVRVGFDDKALKTAAWARAFVDMCRDSVAYFKSHGVRVANMSWGWDVHEIEDNLADHGVGVDAGERAALAKEIFDILEEGLNRVLAGAPEILFVNGAGDAPGDPAEYRWIPGIFDLPNVIAVGAVDASGRLTPFSAHGSHVRLLADGYHVDSFVPGGDCMKLSGTSMSAPQVTNLAAKLFALDPSLTPKKAIDLIVDGGEHVELNGRRQILLNPKRSIALLQAGDKDG